MTTQTEAPARYATAAVAATALTAAMVYSPAAPAISAKIAHGGVTLTAGIGDTLSGIGDAWKDLFTTTQSNVTDLAGHVDPSVPFPVAEQLIASGVSDPSGLQNTLQDGLNAAVVPFTTGTPDMYSSLSDVPGTLTLGGSFLGSDIGSTTLDAPSHLELFNTLTGSTTALESLMSALGLDVTNVNGTDILNALLGDLGVNDSSLLSAVDGIANGLGLDSINLDPNQFLDFAASPLSGVLWGDVSVLASIALQLDQDFTQVSTDFTTQDWSSLLTDVLNDPVNLTNALFNGYGTVDLADLNSGDALQSLIGDLGGDISKMASVDVSPTLDLGGLFSGGGSLLDSLGLDATGNLDLGIASGTADLDMPGEAVGPIGSLIELGDAMAMGMGWDGVTDPITELFSGIL